MRWPRIRIGQWRRIVGYLDHLFITPASCCRQEVANLNPDDQAGERTSGKGSNSQSKARQEAWLGKFTDAGGFQLVADSYSLKNRKP